MRRDPLRKSIHRSALLGYAVGIAVITPSVFGAHLLFVVVVAIAAGIIWAEIEGRIADRAEQEIEADLQREVRP